VTRILIVDDEPQILRALRINLAARHYEVIAAADGTQALVAVAAEHPDLVVLDLGLPDIDGVEVIRKLRTSTPVPVLVLSGRLDSAGKIAALDAGALPTVNVTSATGTRGACRSFAMRSGVRETSRNRPRA
jgi:two-component system KDP operon response regulator KdpE